MRHRFHSLCPYFAMFPESFAAEWIDSLTAPGDVVLDPFSGRGTTAFQALLMGRRSVACDVNDVAFCLTKAKTNAPKLFALRRRITQLERQFDSGAYRPRVEENGEFFRHAFAPRTLEQLLYLRDVVKWRESNVDAMIAALILGSLHGEIDASQTYLSNQMPRTISTKPAYSVRYWKQHGLTPPDRDVFRVLRDRAAFRYESDPPKGKALVFHKDMRELPRLRNKLPGHIRAAITSPPYFDVTNFEEDQWLRLWLLGGPPYPTRNRVSRDDRHTYEQSYWSFIADMWRSLGTVLSPKAHVIIRIGSTRVDAGHLERALTACSRFSERRVRHLSTSVSALRHRQTDAFRPGSKGIGIEADCHYRFDD
ncbi:MAG: DNA methylase [Candidatus Hydrogenedentes bacterium]|nr:DNA methylase [Candidatus Hydrogenedentota bacterium]